MSTNPLLKALQAIILKGTKEPESLHDVQIRRYSKWAVVIAENALLEKYELKEPVMKNPVQSCLAFAAALQKIMPVINSPKETGNLLDFLTKEHTGFENFAELTNAPGGYFPSIQTAPEQPECPQDCSCEGECMARGLPPYNVAEVVHMASGRKVTLEWFYNELDCLAIAYNIAQEGRGDTRRAFRS